jgi:hypothetical protein
MVGRGGILSLLAKKLKLFMYSHVFYGRVHTLDIFYLLLSLITIGPRNGRARYINVSGPVPEVFFGGLLCMVTTSLLAAVLAAAVEVSAVVSCPVNPP